MKPLLHVLATGLLLMAATGMIGQNTPDYSREKWLLTAAQCKPVLTETAVKPIRVVQIVRDSLSFQGWKAEPVADIETIYQTSFKKLNSMVVDFGNHYTGYLSLKIASLGSTPDGPLRFKVTFAEVPGELAVPFDPYPGGISRAWLQDEVMTVMDPLSLVKLGRRVSGRYVKLELLASSPYFDFTISHLEMTAVTAVDRMPEPISPNAESIIQQIDQVGLNTLKECMQTVYEDGPKRDSRLWIGDLYLESIANAWSFKNFDLTKRCLYLLAGLTDNRGYLHGTVFENPTPHPQANQFLMDYALLYNVSLKEYLATTGDKATALDLWPVAKRQLDIVRSYLQPDGLINYEKANAEWWLFFDWKDGLHKQAAIQGLSIYALKESYELAKMLNKESELQEIPGIIRKMTKASWELYNKKTHLFESGPDKQISYASQIWMVLGGVLTREESQKTLNALGKYSLAVEPGAPYLYHFYIQALVNSGMNQEAKEHLIGYWGGMVNKGADTFWEVYDPTNELLSPYNFFPVNSYCHAWSCTALYFIRKYPGVFQSMGKSVLDTKNMQPAI